METSKTWEEGKAESRAEGRAEGRAEMLLNVLKARGIDVPEEARVRILAQRDPDVIDRLLKKFLVASSISGVLDALD